MFKRILDSFLLLFAVSMFVITFSLWLSVHDAVNTCDQNDNGIVTSTCMVAELEK